MDLDREEAEVQQFLTDRSFELQLGGPDEDDGISVVEEAGSRWMRVRNFGSEECEPIRDEVAELLLCVLWKISERLNKGATDRRGERTEQ